MIRVEVLEGILNLGDGDLGDLGALDPDDSDGSANRGRAVSPILSVGPHAAA